MKFKKKKNTYLRDGLIISLVVIGIVSYSTSYLINIPRNATIRLQTNRANTPVEMQIAGQNLRPGEHLSLRPGVYEATFTSDYLRSGQHSRKFELESGAHLVFGLDHLDFWGIVEVQQFLNDDRIELRPLSSKNSESADGHLANRHVSELMPPGPYACYFCGENVGVVTIEAGVKRQLALPVDPIRELRDIRGQLESETKRVSASANEVEKKISQSKASQINLETEINQLQSHIIESIRKTQSAINGQIEIDSKIREVRLANAWDEIRLSVFRRFASYPEFTASGHSPNAILDKIGRE